MHDNANITSAITEADATFAIILTLQPRVAAGKGASREDQIIEMAKDFHEVLPNVFDVAQVGLTYPTDYYESMNTVLVQECQRYNKLLKAMHISLVALQKALKGLVVLSAELEAMGNSMFNQVVPENWSKSAFPSLKPCTPWFKDLIARLAFTQNWIDHGVPPSYWISGFFFPQGFLTACLQNFARAKTFPIDTVSFDFIVVEKKWETLTKPEDGVYIRGLFLEGARWDSKIGSINDSLPKQLYTDLPVLHLNPKKNRKDKTEGIYRCPVYKILSRRGTLSTTGHSTNFIMWIELPSNRTDITNNQGLCDQEEWIRAGVAAFSSLMY
jgi:dynein heavy chain